MTSSPDSNLELVEAGAEPSRLAIVVGLGVVVAAALAWLTPYNDYYIGATYVATHHVPLVASVLLALVAGALNPLLGRLRPGLRLSRGELAALWVTLATPSGLASSALMRFLVPVLPALRYYATPENRFQDLLWPHYPGWFTLTDDAAIQAFYDGATGPMLPYWRAWLTPAFTWSAIALLVWWVMFVLAGLLRRQWCDHERMSFPQVQLPLEIVGNPTAQLPFFRSRLMWLGFAAPVVLYGFTGLHEFFPTVPKPSFVWPNYYAHSLRFDSPPWSNIPPILPAVLPSMVAFGYLVTAEVSFSIWAGYMLLNAESFLLAASGLGLRVVASGTGQLQFASYQDMGAFVAVAFMILYVARRHLADIWRSTLGSSRSEGQLGATPSRREGRSAYSGLLISGALAFAGLVAILSAAGLSLPLAVAFLGMYFLICVVLAWVTSNTGLLLVSCSFRPEDFVYYLGGTRGLGTRNLAVMALPSRVLTFYYREYLMPHFLNGLKLADETGLDRRSASIAMWTGVLAVLPVAWAAHLWLAYAKGANALQALSYRSWAPVPFRAAVADILNPRSADPQAYVFVALGAVATAAVLVLRARLTWWPLHPVGLILGSISQEIWLSMFVAWLCKVLLLRYGGPGTYRAGRTFFMGLALGEAAIATVWIVVGLMTHVGVRLLP